MNLHRYTVYLYMRSGAVITGDVTRLKQKHQGDDLTGLSWDGDMPFYFRMADITAIVTKRRLNWRGLFKWRA